MRLIGACTARLVRPHERSVSDGRISLAEWKDGKQ